MFSQLIFCQSDQLQNVSSVVSANILPSLVWRHTRVYCIHVFKIMKTLSCSVARNNDLLRKEETIGQLIHTNEAYAHTLYTRICVYAYAYMHTRIRVLGWRVLRVYFGSDISELHCNTRQPNTHIRVCIYMYANTRIQCMRVCLISMYELAYCFLFC